MTSTEKSKLSLRSDTTASSLASEPDLAEEVLTAFRGRYRWLSTTIVVINLAAFAGLVFAVIRILRLYRCGDAITLGRIEPRARAYHVSS